MRKVLPSKIKRPMIAKDGSVYFIRRLVQFGKTFGMYVPMRMVEALGWDQNTALMVWIQSDVLCVQEIQPPQVATRLIPIPPRETRPDRVPPDEEA
jgi:hypothetical protein